MINLAEIIKSALITLIDQLKFNKPRYWAILGAFLITAEALLLSGIFTWADKIPTVAYEVLIGLVLYFNNTSTTAQMIAIESGDKGGTLGEIMDKLLAKVVEQFKAGNMTAWTAVASILGGFKFYLLQDPTLNWPELVVNGLLSLALLFAVPRTKPQLIKLDKVEFDSAKFRLPQEVVKTAA